jgi:sirohydrochlorin cobaltochelatase
VKEPSLEQLLETELAPGELAIGEVAIRPLQSAGFEIAHRNTGVSPAEEFAPQSAIEIAKFDDAGRYRPLRTAPNLRHGWKINVADVSEVVEVIDAIYPGRLAAWCVWKLRRLTTTPLRQTLTRQSGMYRAAAKISDRQMDELVGNFCRSDGGCLRTILWRRDDTGQSASSKLPAEKFDAGHDQTGRRSERVIPLLCQEACNLLVSACRDVVKRER